MGIKNIFAKMALFSLISSGFFGGFCLAAGKAGTFSSSYRDNNLSVNIQNSTLNDVLEQVGDKTGVKFECNKKISDNVVRIEFTSLPMDEAIRRILSKFNYAVICSETGKIRKVIVFGLRTPRPAYETPANNRTAPLASNTPRQQTTNMTALKSTNASKGVTAPGQPEKAANSSASPEETPAPDSSEKKDDKAALPEVMTAAKEKSE
jgi:hypothetical protein